MDFEQVAVALVRHMLLSPHGTQLVLVPSGSAQHLWAWESNLVSHKHANLSRGRGHRGVDCESGSTRRTVATESHPAHQGSACLNPTRLTCPPYCSRSRVEPGHERDSDPVSRNPWARRVVVVLTLQSCGANACKAAERNMFSGKFLWTVCSQILFTQLFELTAKCILA